MAHEKIKENFKKLVSTMKLDETFLLVVLGVLVGIMSLLVIFNMISNAGLRNAVEKNLKERRVLIIDSYGSQYYKNLGFFDDATITMFAIKSVRTLMELTYDNTFAIDYSKKYATKQIQDAIQNALSSQTSHLKLDNGSIKINWTSMRQIEANDKAGSWVYELVGSKIYKKLDGDVVLGDYIYVVRIDRSDAMSENEAGLIITSLAETKVVVER